MAVIAGSARITLRPVSDADRGFLIALYASTRSDLALVPLDPALRDDLVRMQYHAQDRSFRQDNPGASFDLVEVGGCPAGRWYVDRSATDVRIVDVSLLPEYRGAGLGRALIEGLQDEAAAAGRTVSLHVATGNPAARLYERLGFRVADDLGVYRLLQWRAP